MILELVIFVFICISCLHYLPFQHWVFHSLEFAKIQLFVVQFFSLCGLLLFINNLSDLSLVLAGILLLLWIHNLIILIPFSSIYPQESQPLNSSKTTMSFLTVNVYQHNDKYELLLDLVKKLKPDILLTLESDIKWEKALGTVEGMYHFSKKIPQDNTYGMHFYTRLKATRIKVNYFVSPDLPSIEADLIGLEGQKFKFFGVHPPPPSPTEEDTSVERDGDILALGKKINKLQQPCLVVGDFNNVAWSKSSKLFKKAAQLIDPRIGRGFISSFHAKYRFLRFPIDLVFHSKSIYVEKIKTERPINSDHFPIYGEFFVDLEMKKEDLDLEKPDKDDRKQMEEYIKKGKSQTCNNRSQKIALAYL